MDSQFATIALNWFIPVAETLYVHHERANNPLFVGINGCQGSGKSTLSQFLHQYLEQCKGLSVVSMSLDDFYLSHSERMALSIKIHPLLATRGVPGTHNTDLIQTVLSALSTQQSATIPRFNKATDDPCPTSQWQSVTGKVDIVLFEGWCWGVLPEQSSALLAPMNDLEKEHDPLGVWRGYVNQQIKEHYVPLYQQMQFWMQLKAPSFNCVYRWRLQQEQKLVDAFTQDGVLPCEATKGIMQAPQIATFIQHYQRLTTHSLNSMAKTCDLVLELDELRNIIASKGLI
ncbi:kinase [Aliiglaciecola litoralis]|uniref:Kinase n=1 Tax=Aliiglaciecola litoralis TaxID=582857 RepID=A0ABN1LCM6_9ALTE